MKRLAASLWLKVLTGVLCLGFAVGCTTVAAPNEQRFDRPALDAMLAPIALYPDRLLSHVLMAATYPEEVEDAARWLRARPGLSGDAAVRAAEGSDWDPSVRSLLAFPLVLDTLADHIRWTADVGQAFLYQREEVMDVIQFLRRRAYQAGTLRSNEAIHVVDTGYAIEIRSVGPETVHVPYYDPQVVYGGWWWPARPPVVWPRWPGYYVSHAAPAFYWGPGIHVSSGFFFGDFAWGRREVRVVDVRPYYYPRRIIVERHVVPGHPAPRIEHRAPAPGVWQHDARRRWNDDARAARRVNEPRRVERRDDDDRRSQRRDIRSESGDDRRGDRRDFRNDGGDDRRAERRNFRSDDRREGAPPARVAEPAAQPPQALARPAPGNASEPRPQGNREGRRARSDEDRAAAIDRPNPPQRFERREGAPPGRGRDADDGDRRGRDERSRGAPGQRAERRDDGVPGRAAAEAPARAAPQAARPQPQNDPSEARQHGNRERPRGSRNRDGD